MTDPSRVTSPTLEVDAAAVRLERGCYPRTMIGERSPDDPVWCWCGHEIVMEIGQCDECQECADGW